MPETSRLVIKVAGGEGTACLLIHGFGSDRLSWSANVAALAAAFQVHVLDLPGHGDSGPDIGDGSISTLAEAVAESMSRHGIEAAHIVGHSLGGAVAMALAARSPERVKSLALIAPLGLGQGVDRDFLSNLVEATDTEALLATLRRLVTKPQLINKLLAKRVLEQLSRDGIREAWRSIAAAMQAAQAEELPALVARIPASLPKLVVWGSDDQINPFAESAVARLGTPPVFIAAAGHLPHIERPDLVNSILVDFLKGAEDGGQPV
jgi:pimeloyl-ACP methyl ester carboxylesterase